MTDQIGTVISTPDGPSASQFSFVIDEDSGEIPVRQNQFVMLGSEEGKLIARVSDIYKTNRYFDRAESVREYERKGKKLTEIFPAERWEYLVGEAKPLGVYSDGRIKRATFPPSPGTEISIIDESILTDFLGMDEENGLHIGSVGHHEVPVKLSMTKLLQKHLAILALSGAGKCLSPGSEILLEDGSVKKISELAEESFQKNEVMEEDGVEYCELDEDFFSVNRDYEVKKSNSRYITRRPVPEKMLRIKTDFGRELEVTPEHPLLSWSNGPLWKESQEFEEGDFMALPSNVNVDGTLQEVNLAERLRDERDIYALNMGESIQKFKEEKRWTWKKISEKLDVHYNTFQYWRKRGKIPLCHLDKINRMYDKDLFEEVEEIAHKFSDPIRNRIEVDGTFAKFLACLFAEGHNSYKYLTFTNNDQEIRREFVELCESIGKSPVKISENEYRVFWKTLAMVLGKVFGLKSSSRDKMIPEVILRSPKNVVSKYLRVLFDCDGYCSKEKPEIEYLISNEETLQRLNALLLRFGIVPKVRKKKAKTDSGLNEYYRIIFRGSENLMRFKEIGFSIDYKKENLEKHLGKKSNPNKGLVPFPSVLSELVGELNLSFSRLGELSSLGTGNISNYIHKKDRPGRRSVEKILEGLEKRVDEIRSLKQDLKELEDLAPSISKKEALQRAEKEFLAEDLDYKDVSSHCNVSSSTVARTLQRRTDPTDNIFEVLSVLDSGFESPAKKGDILEELECAIEAADVPFEELDSVSGLYGGCAASLFRGRAVTYTNIRRTLEALEEFLEDVDLEGVQEKIGSLRNVMESEIYWDRIREVEEIEPDYEYVYDLVLQGSHNFIANGAVVHNSYLTSVMIEELLDRDEEVGQVGTVVVDTHGEYIGFGDDEDYRDRVRVIRGRDLKIGASNLTPSLFFHLKPNLSGAQRREISRVLREIRKDKSDEAYSLSDIADTVAKDESIKASTKEVLLSEISQLERTGLFGVADNPPVEDLVNPGEAAIIDVSDFTSLETRQMLVTYLGRKLFFKRQNGDVPPFLFVLEEAHNFAPEGKKRHNALSRPIIQRIAREGRKFHSSLCLVSQRPIKLDTTALSQCNTNIIMRITNPYDQDHIGKSSEGLTRDVLDIISSLRVGEAFIVGEAVNYPLFAQIRERKSIESERGMPLEEAAKKYAEEEEQRDEDAESFM